MDIVDAARTRRTITDLLACGFTVEQIGGAAGRPPSVIPVLLTLGWVSRATADAITRADRQLLGQRPGPGDIDEVAVARLVAGRPPETFTTGERREAVRQLHAAGFTASETAERLGTYRKMIERDVAALGLSVRRTG